MADKKQETIHDLVWTKLTRGVTDKLESDGTVVDKWSPNNIRRLIISPEGVVFQTFITKGTFFNKPIGVVEFPVSEDTQKDLQTKTVISVLHRNRVLSSIEEIVLIPRSPNTPYMLSQNEINSIKSKISSFKRLANIIVVGQPMAIKDFVAVHLKDMGDPYNLLTDANSEVIKGSNVVTVAKDWYNHTSLRPQFYVMDEEGKALSNYFKDVKEKVTNLKKESLSTGKKGNKEEKESKSDKDGKLAYSKLSKKLLIVRSIQENFIQNEEKMGVKINFLKECLGNPNETILSAKTKFKLGKDKDSNLNELLTKLGLYSNEGSTDSSALEEELVKQVMYRLADTVKKVQEKYPVFGDALKGKLEEFKIPKQIHPEKTPNQLRKAILWQYRNTDNQATMLANSQVGNEIKESLIMGIQLSQEEIESVTAGILFDLDFKHEDVELIFEDRELVHIQSKRLEGVDLVVLHDLYIYANNVPHRMYNSLFSKGVTGSKGYVTNQAVGERIQMLIKETGNQEWDKCIQIADSIIKGVFKKPIAEVRESVVDAVTNIIRYENEDEETKREIVANGVLECIVNLSHTTTSKLYTFFYVEQNSNTSLGTKDYKDKDSKILSKIGDKSKSYNESYSDYLEFLKAMVINRRGSN